MSFKEFENALELLATDKGVPGESLRQKVADSSGPMCNATQASAVRLHDDKSTYTGQPRWWSQQKLSVWWRTCALTCSCDPPLLGCFCIAQAGNFW